MGQYLPLPGGRGRGVAVVHGGVHGRRRGRLQQRRHAQRPDRVVVQRQFLERKRQMRVAVALRRGGGGGGERRTRAAVADEEGQGHGARVADAVVVEAEDAQGHARRGTHAQRVFRARAEPPAQDTEGMPRTGRRVREKGGGRTQGRVGRTGRGCRRRGHRCRCPTGPACATSAETAPAAAAEPHWPPQRRRSARAAGW